MFRRWDGLPTPVGMYRVHSRDLMYEDASEMRDWLKLNVVSIQVPEWMRSYGPRGDTSKWWLDHEKFIESSELNKLVNLPTNCGFVFTDQKEAALFKLFWG